MLDMIVLDEEDTVENNEHRLEDPGQHNVDVTLPPFGPESSSDARSKVRKTLRLFHALCRKLLQREEAKTSESSESKSILSRKRIDLVALRIIVENSRYCNVSQNTFGPVPGVEIGDEFQYRVELALVGIHRILEGDVDYIKQEKEIFAVSIVVYRDYDDEFDDPDSLIYSISGAIEKDNEQIGAEKLENGILALKNTSHKYLIRVVRGYKDSKYESGITYLYDGLYTVERYWQEPVSGPVFKFELKRVPGQPELAFREVKSFKKFKIREGICVDDISSGKESFQIRAINTINNDKPPPFHYVTKMVYPDWCRPVPPPGCGCAGRCSGERCRCAVKNSGEIPYNHNGALVEAKPLVYECGPSCKCPPTCCNRVTQHGIKIQLEIFKTGSRGWGVRPLSSVPSGSFICEYIGELLEDTEAEIRSGNDGYLFDIGNNNNNNNTELNSTGGFIIDAKSYGNVGRFINHSCSPNLYAQNVVYDVEDERMAHIMLFAAENIAPLQELTYHYNYDSDGNMAIKSCYCGSSECTGRLY